MKTVKLALYAMATRFELVLHGDDETELRAIGEDVFNEISALSEQLNFHCPDSEVSHINTHASLGPVTVEPGLFRLLQEAKLIHKLSGGAFDITIAPLMRCWGFTDGPRLVPSPRALAEARQCVGMDWVHLDADNFTVQFERSGVLVDLGAVGKGYALEIANEILRDVGVVSALIHGGTSSVCAIGSPPDGEFWNIAIEHPDTAVPDHERIVALAKLQDESFSVSAGWGKAFEENGVSYGHVMDPGLGQPVQNALLAAVALSGGTASDAWSTALLVAGAVGAAALGKASVGSRSLIMLPSSESGYRLTNDGFDLPQR